MLLLSVCAFFFSLACARTQQFHDPELSALHLTSSAFEGSSGRGHIFSRLMYLVETAHAYDDHDVSAFAPLLDDTVYYVHHERGNCHGVAQAVACLIKEHKELTAGNFALRRTTEVAAVRDFHVVRQLTELRKGLPTPTRLLDVYFVRLSNATGPPKIRVLERIGPVDAPVDVLLLMEDKK
jgi:hypothetical protein